MLLTKGGNIVAGFLFSLIAGAAMSFQGVMNTRLGDKVGVLETNVFVQGAGLVLALVIMLIFGKGDLTRLPQAPWYAWLGGLLAPVITVTVMLGMGMLNPLLAVSTILIAQLGVAALIDSLGWLGTNPVPFTWHKVVGLVLMCAGVILMKLKSS